MALTQTRPRTIVTEDASQAIERLSALAQASRLAVFRLLVREAPDGLPVGEIAVRLGIVPSTLSSHLGVLRRARLLRATRHRREVHYSADLEGMGALVEFLVRDCCNGAPHECEQLLTALGCRRT